MTSKKIIANVETTNGEDVENTYGITFKSIESATDWLKNNGGGSIRIEDKDNSSDWDIIVIKSETTDPELREIPLPRMSEHFSVTLRADMLSASKSDPEYDPDDDQESFNRLSTEYSPDDDTDDDDDDDLPDEEAPEKYYFEDPDYSEEITGEIEENFIGTIGGFDYDDYKKSTAEQNKPNTNGDES